MVAKCSSYVPHQDALELEGYLPLRCMEEMEHEAINA